MGFDYMILDGLTVLITGGTGSFGKSFTQTILKGKPRKVIIFSRDELKQSEMRQEVNDDRVLFFLGDVRDRDRLYRSFNGVDVVIHAAALKQVPALEYSPQEAIKTNILGASNIIDAAIDMGVRKVIGISTDKAVNPVNLYGATKLAMEKLLIAGNSYVGKQNTRFSLVRYGNVAGSRGSVIPLFQKAKEQGFIPITDRRMTRFWITLNEGVQLVLKALEEMKGGEIFIPKIPSVRIIDIGEAIAPGMRQEIVGIRPGEKLHEVLVSESESPMTFEYKDYYTIHPSFPFWTNKKLNGGKKVKDGFRYDSYSNERWLTIPQIKEFICQM